MDVITYSLRAGENNSETYYQEVRKFSDEVLLKASDSITPLALEYMNYIRTYKLEDVRKIEEYILELISFGVLMRSYARKALKVHIAPFITMTQMAEWRKKHQHAKPFIDFARGILTTIFLLPKVSNEKSKTLKLEDVDHFCKWLEATGEFREQALRFLLWRGFWGVKSGEELNEIFSVIENFALWFEEESVRKLGKYSEQVDDFIKNSAGRYRWREDRISCTRTRVEYHLNMVGADLMNRAFRNEYKNTELKVVLVPGCMRFYNNDKCKALKTKKGLMCTKCNSKCRVYQLTEMGDNPSYGFFDVFVIPHASDLSLWSPKANQPAKGVIASACVTTLVEGGWELKRYGVPAQCVLLDYSGCKKHWHKEGISTALNLRELKRILNKSDVED